MSGDATVSRGAPERRFSRALALLVSVVFIALSLWPALRDPPEDSFPLSTYPMFSTVRKTTWLHVVVGYDAAGEEYKIPPPLVANFEVMQAAQTIRKAIRRKRAKQLCEEVAAKVAGRPGYTEVVRLEVQSRLLDPRSYFTPGGEVPKKIKRRARCELVRKGTAP